MVHRTGALLVALSLTAGAAQSATVGSFVLDDDAFADDARIDNTVSGTRGPAQSPASAADGDLSTASNLNDSFVEILFTDNVVVNGPGDDLVLFTNTNNNVIRVSLGNTFNDVSTTSIVGTAIPLGATGNTSGFGLTGQTIDLTALGVADGGELSSLFLYRGGVFTTVWDVAAINSRSAGAGQPQDPGASAVPLPAGLPLMLGGLGLLGLLRRSRG